MPKGKQGFQKGNAHGKRLRQTEDRAVIKLLLSSEERENGCICATRYLNDRGYPRMRVMAEKKYMSHVIYERYKGEIPEGMWMLHKCDTPACINPDHLFIGDNDDNMKDMASKGRGRTSGVGENHHNAKLTNEQARDILNRYKPRVVTAISLAEEYGVPRTTVTSLVARKGRNGYEL